MFVLLGQILNARGRFGPMMWAPIANNLISIAILATYLVLYNDPSSTQGGYTSQQELLLGIGSTIGIVAQTLILLPYLRRSGLPDPATGRLPGHRPRAHLAARQAGPSAFVVVNQIAFYVMVRRSTARDRGGGRSSGVHRLLERLSADAATALDRDGVARDRHHSARLTTGRRRADARDGHGDGQQPAPGALGDRAVRGGDAGARSGAGDGALRLRGRGRRHPDARPHHHGVRTRAC